MIRYQGVHGISYHRLGGPPGSLLIPRGPSIKQKKVRNSASQLMDYFVVFIKIGKFENQNNLHFNSSKSFVSDCVVKN